MYFLGPYLPQFQQSAGATLFYCWAKLLESRFELACENSPWAVNLWQQHYQTVGCGRSGWLCNCLRYAACLPFRYSAIEPLMCRAQLRVPWGRIVNSTTDCNIKTTGSTQKRHFTVIQQSLHHFINYYWTMWCDILYVTISTNKGAIGCQKYKFKFEELSSRRLASLALQMCFAPLLEAYIVFKT